MTSVKKKVVFLTLSSLLVNQGNKGPELLQIIIYIYGIYGSNFNSTFPNDVWIPKTSRENFFFFINRRPVYQIFDLNQKL